jgi:hypothetical protein
MLGAAAAALRLDLEHPQPGEAEKGAPTDDLHKVSAVNLHARITGTDVTP